MKVLSHLLSLQGITYTSPIPISSPITNINTASALPSPQFACTYSFEMGPPIIASRNSIPALTVSLGLLERQKLLRSHVIWMQHDTLYHCNAFSFSPWNVLAFTERRWHFEQMVDFPPRLIQGFTTSGHFVFEKQLLSSVSWNG